MRSPRRIVKIYRSRTRVFRARRDKVCEALARMRSSASQVRAERQVIVGARARLRFGARSRGLSPQLYIG